MSERNHDPAGPNGNAATVDDGRVYWRSLEAVAGSDEYQQFLQAEFPTPADALPNDAVSRERSLRALDGGDDDVDGRDDG